MKPQIDKKTVEHVAKLSRIRLSGKEVALYQKQLANILDYINQLNKADTAGTLPTSHPLERLKNVFREDQLRKSLPVEKALQNAPERKDNFFSVPKIIE